MTKLLFRPITWKADGGWAAHGNGWYFDAYLSKNETSVAELRKLILTWQSDVITTEYALEHPDGTLELFLERPA